MLVLRAMKKTIGRENISLATKAYISYWYSVGDVNNLPWNTALYENKTYSYTNMYMYIVQQMLHILTVNTPT